MVCKTGFVDKIVYIYFSWQKLVYDRQGRSRNIHPAYRRESSCSKNAPTSAQLTLSNSTRISRSGKDVLCHCGEEDQCGGGGRHNGPGGGVAEVRGACAWAVVVAAVPLMCHFAAASHPDNLAVLKQWEISKLLSFLSDHVILLISSKFIYDVQSVWQLPQHRKSKFLNLISTCSRQDRNGSQLWLSSRHCRHRRRSRDSFHRCSTCTGAPRLHLPRRQQLKKAKVGTWNYGGTHGVCTCGRKWVTIYKARTWVALAVF